MYNVISKMRDIIFANYFENLRKKEGEASFEHDKAMNFLKEV
jgi:hypothetical protein